MHILLACLVLGAQPRAVATTNPPPAQTEPRVIGFGANAKIGVLVPTNKLHTTYVIGIELRERFPFLKRMLGVAAEVAYFQPQLSGGSTSDLLAGQSYSYNATTRAVQLAVDAMFFLPLRLPVDFYAAVGYSAFFYQVTAVTTAAGAKMTTSEISTNHGVRLRGGALWKFKAPLYVAAEVIYHYAGFNYAITGNQNAGAVLFNAGFGFEL
jgi:hypothetical protein